MHLMRKLRQFTSQTKKPLGFVGARQMGAGYYPLGGVLARQGRGWRMLNYEPEEPEDRKKTCAIPMQNG